MWPKTVTTPKLSIFPPVLKLRTTVLYLISGPGGPTSDIRSRPHFSQFLGSTNLGYRAADFRG